MLNLCKLEWTLIGCLVLTLAGPGMAQAQVKFFDRVPTAHEIQDALNGRSAEKPGVVVGSSPRMRSRGITWNTPNTESEIQTSSPQDSSPALALPVQFESGAARVSTASMAYINAVALTLLRNPEMRLVIEGHTDAVGNPRANVMLSWERSFSVFRLMVQKYGIDPTRLQPAGKGSLEPLVPSGNNAAMNRRVQFRLLTQG
jgi:OOP family OmpA-OmpF porin